MIIFDILAEYVLLADLCVVRWLQIYIFILYSHFLILGIPFLEPGRTDSCTRISNAMTEDDITTIFYGRLRHYFILDDSICAAEEVNGKIYIYNCYGSLSVLV